MTGTPRSQPSLRLTGALVGVFIGWIASVLATTAFLLTQTFETQVLAGWSPIIAGGLAGWLVGPSTASANGWRCWTLRAVGMAAIAIVLGSLVYVETTTIASILRGGMYASTGADSPIALVAVLLQAAMLGVIGVPLFGLAEAPWVLIAAILWVLVMRRGVMNWRTGISRIEPPEAVIPEP
jgi:hypothetical protein